MPISPKPAQFVGVKVEKWYQSIPGVSLQNERLDCKSEVMGIRGAAIFLMGGLLNLKPVTD